MTFFEATPGLLETKVFWNKGYDVIILDHDVINTILSRDSNYIVDVVIWPKFGSSSVPTREVIITSILQGFYQKNHLFFEGWEKYLAEWRPFFFYSIQAILCPTTFLAFPHLKYDGDEKVLIISASLIIPWKVSWLVLAISKCETS